MPEFEPPYLIFLGAAHDALAAKTGVACAQWRRDACVGQIRLEGCRADAGLPDLDVAAAAARGARSLVLGVVASGGRLQPAWTDVLVAALEHGLDVVSGMHDRLGDEPRLRAAAARTGRRLVDLRHTSRRFETATGRRRTGRRLLTVGTDCSCGKMFTTLLLERALKARGTKCTFRATGQTGILLAGDGVAVDALVADFVAGAAEWLTPDNDPDHWDLVEGQGSLFHPAFAGVTLGLVHGAQPDVLVLCHEPTRTHLRGLPHRPMPALRACIDAHVEAARLTNPAARCVGVSVNTAALDEAGTKTVLARVEAEVGLPALDPAKQGVDRWLERLP